MQCLPTCLKSRPTLEKGFWDRFKEGFAGPASWNNTIYLKKESASFPKQSHHTVGEASISARLIPLPEGDYSAGLVTLITGSPGSGKGTQAVRIAREFGFLHLSVGDLLRAEREADTELGRQAASFMDTGELVPDSIIAETVLSRLPDPLTDNEAKLCNALHARAHDHELLRSIFPGVLLDGFPRTVEQAILLKGALQGRGHRVGLAVHLQVSDHEAVARMMGRGRSDDTEETVRRRLEVYYEQTVPLLDGLKDVLVEIDGSQDVEDVFVEVQRAVADRL